MVEKNIFSENLKRIRISKNLSQYELENICHIARTSICFYERGTRYPSLETAKKLSDGLGVSLEELGWKNRKTKKQIKYSRLTEADIAARVAFGRQIREARLDKRMTQETVANAVGVSPSQYRMYESGRRMPRHLLYQKILDFLEIKIISENLVEIEESKNITLPTNGKSVEEVIFAKKVELAMKIGLALQQKGYINFDITETNEMIELKAKISFVMQKEGE